MAEAPPADESVLWASRVLRLAVALQCLGVALLMIVQKAPSPLNEYLLYQGVEDDTVRLIDQLVGYAMFGIAASVLLFPIAPVVLIVAAWAGVSAWATQMNDGDAYAYLALWAQMVRYIAPIALILLLPWPGHLARPGVRTSIAAWLLRISAAVVFLAHGYEAFTLNPRFVDYILHFGQTFFIQTWPQETVEWILRVIGVQDVVLAAALLGVWPRAAKRSLARRATQSLIIGVAAGLGVYFLGNFAEAHPFIDWIAAELARSLKWQVSAGTLVLVVVVLAGLLAMLGARYWRALLIYMTTWGALTACARVLDGGFRGLDDTLIRACNSGAPLALLLLLHIALPQHAPAESEPRRKKPKPRPAAPEPPKPRKPAARPATRPTEIILHEEPSEPEPGRRPI